MKTNDQTITTSAARTYRTLARSYRDAGSNRPLAEALDKLSALLHDEVIPADELAVVLAGACPVGDMLRRLADVIDDDDPEADTLDLRAHAHVLDLWTKSLQRPTP